MALFLSGYANAWSFYFSPQQKSQPAKTWFWSTFFFSVWYFVKLFFSFRGVRMLLSSRHTLLECCVSGRWKIKTPTADLEVHFICVDKLGIVTAAFLTFPCCKCTNMQKITVQCFGCRIDNLKCVPICTRSTLQMSESFLFTWQIVRTPKKLLLSFSCSLCNLSFFLSLFYFTIYIKNLSLT